MKSSTSAAALAATLYTPRSTFLNKGTCIVSRGGDGGGGGALWPIIKSAALSALSVSPPAAAGALALEVREVRKEKAF
jgi:hypothetical protein